MHLQYPTGHVTRNPNILIVICSFWTQQCSDIFGASINETVLNNAIKFTNANYGGLGVKVSRIIFPNGSIDPWHALSVTKDLSPEAIALFINGLYIIYSNIMLWL